MRITPVRHAANLGEQVAHRLRVLVITGEFPAGTHLVEERLAREFDVSRGPIRDALRQLEAEGLLEPRRRGVSVIGLDERDVDELYSLRRTLESLAVRISMQRQDLDWSALQRSLDAMRAAADAHAPEDFAVADLEFHAHFYTLSEHRRLISVWEHYRPTFSVLLSVTNAQDADLHPSAEAHATLLDAVRGGDVDEALQELEHHLLGARNRMRAAMGE